MRIPIDDTTEEALQARIDELIWDNFELREAFKRLTQLYEKSPAMCLSASAISMYDIARKALDRVSQKGKRR